jgi:hypothetical protein
MQDKNELLFSLEANKTRSNGHHASASSPGMIESHRMGFWNILAVCEKTTPDFIRSRFNRAARLGQQGRPSLHDLEVCPLAHACSGNDLALARLKWSPEESGFEPERRSPSGCEPIILGAMGSRSGTGRSAREPLGLPILALRLDPFALTCTRLLLFLSYFRGRLSEVEAGS